MVLVPAPGDEETGTRYDGIDGEGPAATGKRNREVATHCQHGGGVVANG